MDCLELLWGHPPYIYVHVSALQRLHSVAVLALSLNQLAQSRHGGGELTGGWFDVCCALGEPGEQLKELTMEGNQSCAQRTKICTKP